MIGKFPQNDKVDFDAAPIVADRVHNSPALTASFLHTFVKPVGNSHIRFLDVLYILGRAHLRLSCVAILPRLI